MKRTAWVLLIGLSIAALTVESGLAPVAFGAGSTTTTATSTTTSTSTTSTAASTTTSTTTGTGPSLSLGFSPSALYPVSEGIPVYTVGDTIWVMSSYSSSVTLTLSSTTEGSSAVTTDAKTTLGTDAVLPLYTFTANNPDGVWNITLSTAPGTGGQSTIIPVHFVNLAAHPTSLGPLSYSLSGDSLLISTTASLGDSYDQQVCATGNDTSAGLSINLPSAMDESGNVTLSPGSLLGVNVAGTVNEPFSFWVELYHSYSLEVMNTNNLVSESLLAAESPPVPFTTSGSDNTTLSWSLPVHEGRYDLRAYFQNSTSLYVVQDSILVLSDSTWVPLTNVCPPEAVQSSQILYSASLAGGPSSWPANFYLMYQTLGVEGVVSAPVMANVSSVDFTFHPWNVTSLSVSVPTSAQVLQTSQAGSSLFVLASQYPTSVAYTLDVNGENDIAQGTAPLVKAYSVLDEQINLGLLTVDVASNRNLTTTISVTGASAVSLTSGPVKANQSASFLVPTAVYTVTGMQGNVSQTAQTNVTDGATSYLTLTFHTIAIKSTAASPYEAIEIVLVGAGLVAVVGQAVLWVGRSRSLGAKLANTSKPEGAEPS